jgi:hypothetical protein
VQLRVSRKTADGKTYEYAQLVESYRRESDGLPMHRVVANLGRLPPLEIENLRLTLAAGRQGRRVALARAPRVDAHVAPKILANLRYLDVAVLLKLWDGWGLTPLLEELLPVGEADIAPAAVVAALSIQRCVDPGSTLYATQWFPKSALPELLGIAAAGYNNTRLHRVLEELERVTPLLMGKLPRRYQEQEGAFTALFLDVTDTWFVGDGPPTIAQYGTTKEGLRARKIGIVLLCNQHGYPLRWEVVQGTAHDSVGMSAMFRAVAGMNWLGTTPVVCDRAMGNTAHLRTMLATGARFVTALVSGEFEAYATTIPYQPFTDFILSGDDDQARQADVDRAATLAAAHGLTKLADNLLVRDLGIVEHVAPAVAAPPVVTNAPREALTAARRIREQLASGAVRSLAEGGRELGLKDSVAGKYVMLTRLSDDIQRDILAGGADGCTLADLLKITKTRDAATQWGQYQQLLATPVRPKQAARRAQSPAAATPAPTTSPAPVRIRAVAYFNPERFVEERSSARRTLAKIQAFVVELNAALARPHAQRTKATVAALVQRKLQSYSLVDAYDVTIHEEPPRLRVELALRPADWEWRRRYDGFCVLAAHPAVDLSAEHLCRLYRAKDAVEKDFHTIKSFVEVRPIWHHTAAKVRAHVTICMLALLLERTLQQRLGGQLTAQAALEQLESCRLNRYQAASHIAYRVTELDEAQACLLRTLGARELGDSDLVAERITAR